MFGCEFNTNLVEPFFKPCNLSCFLQPTCTSIHFCIYYQ